MALSAIEQVRFGALADLPPIPQHYHTIEQAIRYAERMTETASERKGDSA